MLDFQQDADPEHTLAQTTRARLFSLLDELRRPASTAELAQRLDLHPNGVRIHLGRLEQAGLLTRSRARQPRGRPADSWAIARPDGQAPRAYRDLSRWLARAMRSGRAAPRALEASGREIGRELAPADGSSHGEELLHALTALGFQPSPQSQTTGALTIRLRNCPYRDAVRENQPAVCALHKGITRGLLDLLEPDAKLAAFEPHDPDEAGCVIDIQGMTGARERWPGP
jgi:predicted ArsR family transcriptional regulator